MNSFQLPCYFLALCALVSIGNCGIIEVHHQNLADDIVLLHNEIVPVVSRHRRAADSNAHIPSICKDLDQSDLITFMLSCNLKKLDQQIGDLNALLPILTKIRDIGKDLLNDRQAGVVGNQGERLQAINAAKQDLLNYLDKFLPQQQDLLQGTPYEKIVGMLYPLRESLRSDKVDVATA
ncbi:unnamed protein product [Hermetia illucens]|uniref:Uncharacterized protein n=1 Tax=Hermetia illucens TaxID=343691 RepID=A0A7R8YP31_HERIL|nr:uncharacterized protein LOC119661631 isoform X1 [Hermetia illucens]CAD7079891.1 unnamed protein product [Hermetia illucens]